MSQGLFSTGFLRLEAAASARESMQAVHAANIANADTPNYRADKRTFEDFLSERLRKLHVDGGEVVASPSFQASSLQRMDGNTVDTQQEMARMAENQMMHDLSMKLLKEKLSGLSNVIKEGGR